MTGFGGVAEAVEAIKHGAIDFLIKPFQLTQLARVIGAAIDQQRLRSRTQSSAPSCAAASASTASSAATAPCRSSSRRWN